MENSPNWLELPAELTSSILLRLGPLEVLMSARKVCQTWRRICSDPAMWRIVDLKNFPDHIHPVQMENVIKKAVDLSCGQLMELHLVLFRSHDNLISYISDRLSSLKYLYIDSFKITGEGLKEVITKLPMLEELHLVSGCDFNKIIEVAGRCCPKLKSLKLMATFYSYQIMGSDDQDALAIAENMPGLHHLQFFGHSGITRDGLLAITNSCPHLETLDLLLSLPMVEPELVGRLSKQIRHLNILYKFEEDSDDEDDLDSLSDDDPSEQSDMSTDDNETVDLDFLYDDDPYGLSNISTDDETDGLDSMDEDDPSGISEINTISSDDDSSEFSGGSYIDSD